MTKTDCEMDIHMNLTLAEYDGRSVWKCVDCGFTIDEMEIINYGVDKACDIILDFLKDDFSKHSFGSEKLNTIRDKIKELRNNE